MQTKEWFGNWFNSSYYHLLYNNRNDNEANAFIAKLIDYLKPLSKSKMLDVACGKGRHSIALNNLGFDVTGIDLSTESIKIAKKSEKENLHFFTHDMRLPFYVNYFDIAFNLFTSFGYFKTQREHNNAIRSIAQSLKPNGFLVIDYLNTHFEENALIKMCEKKIDEYNFVLTKWHTQEHFFKQIQVADCINGLPRHLSTERVAKFSLGDFNEMLSLQDMQIQNVFGDYNLQPYNINTSSRMIIIAKKLG